MDRDSFTAMAESVLDFHKKHRFKERGGEEMTYRISLMAEELGEISACVTKGRGKEDLGEELADLLILVIGCGIAQDIDLGAEFWKKMEKLASREARIIDGRVRVSEFRGRGDG
jgi:NTP pyrophosphatase (non-canonical NTP hydrolase)